MGLQGESWDHACGLRQLQSLNCILRSKPLRWDPSAVEELTQAAAPEAEAAHSGVGGRCGAQVSAVLLWGCAVPFPKQGGRKTATRHHTPPH